MSVVCLVIRVLSIVRIFLGYPYFMAINSVNKTVVGYSSPPEQARLHMAPNETVCESFVLHKIFETLIRVGKGTT